MADDKTTMKHDKCTVYARDMVAVKGELLSFEAIDRPDSGSREGMSTHS